MISIGNATNGGTFDPFGPEGEQVMAHFRKPLAAAAGLNTGIFVVEAIAGYQASSLSR